MQFKPFVYDRENQQIPVSIMPMSRADAEWYCRNDPERERFYEIFFQMCRKYSVRWASADEKERQFVQEITRVTYERERAIRLGLPLTDVRPAFAS